MILTVDNVMIDLVDDVTLPSPRAPRPASEPIRNDSDPIVIPPSQLNHRFIINLQVD